MVNPGLEAIMKANVCSLNSAAQKWQHIRGKTSHMPDIAFNKLTKQSLLLKLDEVYNSTDVQHAVWQ